MDQIMRLWTALCTLEVASPISHNWCVWCRLHVLYIMPGVWCCNRQYKISYWPQFSMPLPMYQHWLACHFTPLSDRHWHYVVDSALLTLYIWYDRWKATTPVSLAICYSAGSRRGVQLSLEYWTSFVWDQLAQSRARQWSSDMNVSGGRERVLVWL